MSDWSVWYFTFAGNDPVYGGYCQPIKARSWGEAREKMFELHGAHWCGQYDEEFWNKMKNDSTRWWPLEKELPLIVADGGAENETD